MKNSVVIPSWALEAMGIAEEMSAVQADNMMGQYLGADFKARLKADKTLRPKLQQILIEIVNSLGVQAGDEKPTLIWLVKQLDNRTINLARFEEDAQQIAAALKGYYKYRRELKKLPEYTYTTLKEAVRELEPEEDGEVKTITDLLHSEPYAQGGPYKIYKIIDVETAMAVGEGTSWCTQGEGYARDYLSDGPLYVVFRNKKRYAQFHPKTDSFMDVNDHRMSKAEIEDIDRQCGGAVVKAWELNAAEIIDDILKQGSGNDNVKFSKGVTGLDIKITDIGYFDDLFNLAHKGRDDVDTKWIADMLSGGIVDIYDYEFSEYNVDEMDDENKEKMITLLRQNGVDEDEYNLDSMKGLYQAILDDDDANTAMHRACIYGAETGAYDEFYGDVLKAIKNAGFQKQDDKHEWIATVSSSQPKALERLRNEGLEFLFRESDYGDEPYFDLYLQQPHYGWDGFNKEVFNERLSEELDEVIKTPESEGQGTLFEEYLKRAKELCEAEDYVGSHQAPDHESGAPLYDVTLNGIYPEDVYSPNGLRYYGDGHASDAECFRILRQYHNRPKGKIRVYRAIPKVITNAERISELHKHKAHILKHGKLPADVNNWKDKSEYYDWADAEIKRLSKLPDDTQEKPKINNGDWVSISRQYAVDHGKTSLNGKYRIISTVTTADKIFTEGNGIAEWGIEL